VILVSTDRITTLRKVSFLLVFFINFILFMTYKRNVKQNVAHIYQNKWNSPFGLGEYDVKNIIYAFGILLNILSTVRAVFYLVLNAKLIVRAKWDERVDDRCTEIQIDEELKIEYDAAFNVKDTEQI
jgi:hypothetical protein